MTATTPESQDTSPPFIRFFHLREIGYPALLVSVGLLEPSADAQLANVCRDLAGLSRELGRELSVQYCNVRISSGEPDMAVPALEDVDTRASMMREAFVSAVLSALRRTGVGLSSPATPAAGLPVEPGAAVAVTFTAAQLEWLRATAELTVARRRWDIANDSMGAGRARHEEDLRHAEEVEIVLRRACGLPADPKVPE